MNVLLYMSIFWIGYGILGLFGIQNIPAKFKGHTWTNAYKRTQGLNWLILGLPWLVFYFVSTRHIPDTDLNAAFEILIYVILSFPALIASFVWGRKYKASLSAEAYGIDNHTE